MHRKKFPTIPNFALRLGAETISNAFDAAFEQGFPTIPNFALRLGAPAGSASKNGASFQLFRILPFG